nr:hypothetical protein [bacterium]
MTDFRRNIVVAVYCYLGAQFIRFFVVIIRVKTKTFIGKFSLSIINIFVEFSFGVTNFFIELSLGITDIFIQLGLSVANIFI